MNKEFKNILIAVCTIFLFSFVFKKDSNVNDFKFLKKPYMQKCECDSLSFKHGWRYIQWEHINKNVLIESKYYSLLKIKTLRHNDSLYVRSDNNIIYAIDQVKYNHKFTERVLFNFNASSSYAPINSSIYTRTFGQIQFSLDSVFIRNKNDTIFYFKNNLKLTLSDAILLKEIAISKKHGFVHINVHRYGGINDNGIEDISEVKETNEPYNYYNHNYTLLCSDLMKSK